MMYSRSEKRGRLERRVRRWTCIGTFAAIGSFAAGVLPGNQYGRFLIPPDETGGKVHTWGGVGGDGMPVEFDEPVHDTVKDIAAGDIAFTYDTYVGPNGGPLTAGGAGLAGGFFIAQGVKVKDGFNLAWVQTVIDQTATGANDWNLPAANAGEFPDATPQQRKYLFQSVPPQVPPAQRPTLGFQDLPSRALAVNQSWLAELGLTCISKTEDEDGFSEVRVVGTFLWGFDIAVPPPPPPGGPGIQHVTPNSPGDWGPPTQSYLDTLNEYYDGSGGGDPPNTGNNEVPSSLFRFVANTNCFEELPRCPDGACQPEDGEDACTCPDDCPGDCPFCGDGHCQYEDACGCPEDCLGECPGCGNGSCDPGEDGCNCPEDCGECPFCGDGFCDPGETCEDCPQDCGGCPPFCGDGFCDPGENACNCPQDCPGECHFCGDGVCGPGENACNCSSDCGGLLIGKPPGTTRGPTNAKMGEIQLQPELAPGPTDAIPAKILAPFEPTRSAMAGPPANDLCADAIPISDGVTPYDTTGADTDGAAHPQCDTGPGDGGATVNDIWYHYTASCTGTLTIATCNEDGGDAFYDSDLVIYDNTDCSDLIFLGCNDDAAGGCTAGGTTFASRLIVDVVENHVYTLRVGGWADAGDEGPGDLSIGCAACGNAICEEGEDCLNCPEDCADGLCEGDDTCGTCPADCGECPCASETPGDCDEAQIGIVNYPLQEFPNAGNCWDLDGNDMCDTETEDIDEDGDCDIADCRWTGLAFPIVVEGTSIDTISFQVNTNFAGGDIYLTGASTSCGDCPTDVDGDGETKAFDLAVLLGAWGPVTPQSACLDADGNGCIGPFDLAVLLGHWGDCPANLGGEACQPNIFDMRRMLGCAVTGLEAGVPHDLHFDAIETTPGETIWAIFVGRSGLAQVSGLGFYNGDPRPGHQVARSDIFPSQPNNSFANLVGTGNAGDWTDLHGFGLGTFYCVSLSATNQDASTYDCVANPEPVGGCCGLTGVACEEMRGFECGAVGGTYLGDGSTCDDCNPFCTEDAGDCCIANGTPGCEDSDCCHYVCDLDPFCCDPKEGEGWTSPCAQEANDTETGCGQLGEVCEPTECVDTTAGSIPECIQTGSDSSVEGYLGIVTDEYGAHASVTWSGGNDDCSFGDWFNPDAFGPGEPIFGAALFWYKTDTEQRVVLSDVPNHDTTYPVDFSGFSEIPEGGENVASDASGNGVNDTLSSAFAVCGPNDVSLEFTLEQKVERFVPLGGAPIAVWTQVYQITNVSGTAISFVLARQDDHDMFWVGNHLNDSVGTMTNEGDPGGDLSVYQLEDGRPSTAVTLSSPQASTYWGGKGGVDPDGDPGPGPPYGCGTDFQQWNAYGVPEGWANHVAGVGYNTDGESGPDIPGGCGGCTCDGSIGITVEITLDPEETKCVCIQHTYGQRVPWMGGTCPEGCNEPFPP